MLVIWNGKQQKPCLHFLKLLAILLIRFCVFEIGCVMNSTIKHPDFFGKYNNTDIEIFVLSDENRLRLLNL